jgi:hypothetical protein
MDAPFTLTYIKILKNIRIGSFQFACLSEPISKILIMVLGWPVEPVEPVKIGKISDIIFNGSTG